MRPNNPFLISGYNRNVDAGLIDYAVSQILAEMSYSYADLLRTYSAGNVRLLKTIANEIVYQTPAGYIVYDRFMGEWLRTQPF